MKYSTKQGMSGARSRNEGISYGASNSVCIKDLGETCLRPLSRSNHDGWPPSPLTSNGNWPVTADAFDSRSCSTRNSAIWISGARSPTSSRKSPAIRRFPTPQAPVRRTGEGTLCVTEYSEAINDSGCGRNSTINARSPAVWIACDGAAQSTPFLFRFRQNQDG